MASTTNVDVIITAKDNASNVLRQVGDSAKSAGSQISETFREGGLAATAFLTSITLLGHAMIKVASDFEQNNVAFETMTGSAKEGRKVLADLSNFAVKTPFELPQLLTASKSLLAYGIATKDLIPTLRNLGDIASGVGMDKLPNLILAFGQVRAATRLTGMELRQFTEAGVPILEILAKQMGKTAAQIKEMISAGEVSFDEVNKALKSMSSEGGKFFNLMEKQSKTFGGTMSNMKDQVTRSLAEIAGIDIQAGGLIREGSLFAILKSGAEEALKAMNSFTPVLVKFTQEIIKSKEALFIIGGALGGVVVLAVGSFITIFGAGILILGKFIAIGAVVGLMVGQLSKHFNDLGNIVDTAKGKLEPLITLIQSIFTRIGQIIQSAGISGEFGGLSTFFATTYEKAKFYLERTLQIVTETYQQIKNFLAFGGIEGNASIIQALEGIWNRIKPIKDALQPLFDQMNASFATAAAVIETQVKPAFSALIETLGPLWTALQPLISQAIVQFFQGIAIALGAIVTVVLAIITGIASGLANALPYIMQALEGIIQFFRGFVQIITAMINGDWFLAFEGFKQMVKGAYDFVTNTFKALETFINGFVKGVIAFFQALYDALIGKSIIPDLVNGAIALFNQMKTTITGTVQSFIDFVVEKFNWLKEQVTNVINAIKALIDSFKPKFKIELELPDIVGAWNSLKQKAHNIGIPGFQTGGIVPGPIGAPALVMAHGGEEIKPVGVGSSGGGGSGIQFNISIGLYAGTEVEKRNIAKSLYAALLQLAASQNKTVQEFMGG